ncbi:TapY2 family type IVa secretion system protein [Shewanella sp. 202IG2-18]|uniref:TapY2 family type IVa secretion system protein n=1 Tax=Parashewanella hymeniacidonis TaxID=2807618 RepID=UPI00195F8FA3|nr:TapY2 family type IVa secretion system protein [Parashewanella hymeniacidonis]MBM7071567.1 TapY2 family type IVa secretion system protein [Parashewanella hymeniacidonis]
MKALILIFFTTLISLFSSITFAEERVAYKCFLETTVGNKVIHFNLKKSKVRKRLANLVASDVPVENNQRALVRHVIECVKASKKFLNKEAAIIEAQSVD